MANSGNSNNRQRFNDTVFVDLLLTAEAEKELKSSNFGSGNWHVFINQVVAQGYKIVLKDDPRGTSGMAMIQSADYDPKASGTIWVMRSGSAAGALLKLCYFWQYSEGTLPEPGGIEDQNRNDDELFL